MKTAISLPDDLFMLAEKFSKERGLNRSDLYATALRAYLDLHRRDDLTEKINMACTELDSSLPADMAQLARRKLLETEW